MRYKELIKILKTNGAVLVRQGKHQTWARGKYQTTIPMKHGKEINKYLAKQILADLNIKDKS